MIVGHRATLHGCTVHDNALIGRGALVLDGAVVEEGAIVAAGAVVTPGSPFHQTALQSASQRGRPGNPQRKKGHTMSKTSLATTNTADFSTNWFGRYREISSDPVQKALGMLFGR